MENQISSLNPCYSGSWVMSLMRCGIPWTFPKVLILVIVEVGL